MQYRDLNTYLRERFGKKVYKISLSTPFTCPNRDGTKGVGGCIFCSGQGSGSFAAEARLPVSEQLRQGKSRVRKKAGEGAGYIAYFQAFTSTYGPVSVQKKLFEEALADPEVVALSVATRPDCLPEEVLELLGSLNEKKPVFVELGLQTAREDTARLLNRCYDNAVFDRAVAALRARGLEVVAHLILGLPGEEHEDELASLSYVCKRGVTGVKFHLLHVLRDTVLAQMDYTPLDFEEYVFRVTDLVRHTPPSVVIHRLTGDGDKRELIAPLWSGDKKHVLNAIAASLRRENVTQGEALEDF
ncbi:MAG: TIGR01212 family radical SAM protein [Clostridia bacterium]|nr:TIGR01212 family radical SAM protein [Clostridia bacterium]